MPKLGTIPPLHTSSSNTCKTPLTTITAIAHCQIPKHLYSIDQRPSQKQTVAEASSYQYLFTKALRQRRPLCPRGSLSSIREPPSRFTFSIIIVWEINGSNDHWRLRHKSRRRHALDGRGNVRTRSAASRSAACRGYSGNETH